MSWWSSVTWDVARAGGMTAYVLLALSVALGLALSMRWQNPRWPRLITNELHGFLTLLSLIFTAVHVAAVWLDPFTRFGWQEIFIPLASHYRPLWMGLGIVAAYLLLAIWISTQLRPWIGYAWWRRLHVLTFGVYLLATVHGIGNGSDTRTAWALALYGGSALLIGALAARRFMIPIGPRGRTHPRLVALTAGVLMVGALWTLTGPAQAGWNAIANNGNGNGSRLGNRTATTAASRPAAISAPFSTTLQGSMAQDGPDENGNTTVRFSTGLQDGTGRSLAITIGGQEAPDGSLDVTTTRMTLGPSSGAPSYEGSLSGLQGDGGDWQMSATLAPTAGSGTPVQVTVSLQAAGSGQVSGSLNAVPVGADSSDGSGSGV